MATEVNYEEDLFIGEDKTLRLHVKDSAGASVDITGWAIKFLVRRKETDTTFLIEKTATVVGAYNPVANPQRATVTLTDDDLANTVFQPSPYTSTAKVYRHSWKRLDANSETVLAYGNWTPRTATQQ